MGISFCHFMKQKWEWRDGKGYEKMGKMWVRKRKGIREEGSVEGMGYGKRREEKREVGKGKS